MISFCKTCYHKHTRNKTTTTTTKGIVGSVREHPILSEQERRVVALSYQEGATLCRLAAGTRTNFGKETLQTRRSPSEDLQTTGVP